MRDVLKRPVFNRDEYYQSTSKIVRWIVLALVLITYPFDRPNGLAVLTLIVTLVLYNGMHYSRALKSSQFFKTRFNMIGVDHILLLALIILSGGLLSPYYPLFYLLILGTIASYGIAGFAFSLSSQVVIALILLNLQLDDPNIGPEFVFVIKLVIVVIFSLVAEQTSRNRDHEYLLENRFTSAIENERERLLSLINSLSSAVLAIDAKGKVYLYNAASLELLNTNRDISGMSIDDLLPLRDEHGKHVNLLRMIVKDGRAHNSQNLYFEAEDGSKIILDLTVTPVHTSGENHNELGGYMAVFRDITKEKTLDEERDEFISVTSHELRTPLAIAEANLSTALLPGYAHIDDKAKPLIDQAHQNIVFLSELIEDLATLSRAERGDLSVKFELINSMEFAEELVRDYSPQATAKNLQLNLDLGEGLGSVVSSRHELREILQNFITNAIKYTSTGKVTLGVRSVAGGTEFSVKDTGIGIATSDMPKIFGKFYRSEDYRTRQTGGTGLGLYITHKLSEKLGAKINYTSRLNHGSIFSVLVPIRTDKAANLAIAAAAKSTEVV